MLPFGLLCVVIGAGVAVYGIADSNWGGVLVGVVYAALGVDLVVAAVRLWRLRRRANVRSPRGRRRLARVRDSPSWGTKRRSGS